MDISLRPHRAGGRGEGGGEGRGGRGGEGGKEGMCPRGRTQASVRTDFYRRGQ
jgi:hypothetical protein